MKRLRDVLLERVKRPALRVLHTTRAGEALMLQTYLLAEEAAEGGLLLDPRVGTAPDWLRPQLERHRSDEERHAALLRARLEALGAKPMGMIDPVSRWKLARLERLLRESGSRFRAGPLVPTLAVAWRLERMGVRVFERHLDVLPDHPSSALLRRLLSDERAHVGICRHALARLVPEDEQPALQSLVARIDRIERAFGVLGACLLLAIGVALWIAQPLASSTSPSPTGADT